MTPDTLPPANNQAPGEQEAPAQTLRQQFADWPQKGDERPQPWDLDALKVPKAERELEPGKPNTVSPVVIRHSYPILASGSQGSAVSELATRLHLLGYETDLARGENPFSVLTHDVLSAVDKFREDHGVEEDPTPYGGNTAQSRARAAHTVGPFTWEAILRASERARQELEG